MTSDFEKDLASGVDEPAPVKKSGPPIEELMAAAGKDKPTPLEQAAQAAAEEIAGRGELESEVASMPPEPAALPAAGGSGAEVGEARRTDRILQALLAINLILLAVMLVMPSSDAERKPQDKADRISPDPFLQPPRITGISPDSPLWDQAVRYAGKGDFAKAIELLEAYLKTAKSMTALERGLVYNALAWYLAKEGRHTESQDYSLKSQQLVARSYLPEDLLNGAHRAEEKGLTAEMRSAYARFLLQLRQASPALRKHEAEAYLKLGDSYRTEAESALERPSGPPSEPPPAEPSERVEPHGGHR